MTTPRASPRLEQVKCRCIVAILVLVHRDLREIAIKVGHVVGLSNIRNVRGLCGTPRAIEEVGHAACPSRPARGTSKGGVRAGAASRRKLPLDPTPGVNNYASLTDRVRREQASVLLPLQAAMAAAAAAAGGSGRLPDDMQKQLALQPELLKGHLSELDYYLAKANFAEYVSKTTGETYPGGKVERELEEVCETGEDFLALLSGRVVEARQD